MLIWGVFGLGLTRGFAINHPIFSKLQLFPFASKPSPSIIKY
jgi:hypothetical protein